MNIIYRQIKSMSSTLGNENNNNNSDDNGYNNI